MRTCLTVAVSALAAFTLTGVASASTAQKPKPPVQLSGKVTNKGVGAVAKGKVEVEADDFYFKKTFIKGKPGTKVAVTIKNEGSTTHTFTIDSQHIDKEIQPGDKVNVKVKIPANGKIANFYCRFHVQSGMQGAFFSKAGAAASKSTSSGGSSSSGGGYGY
jgi:plastocyanin